MKVKTTRPVAIAGEHYDAGKSIDVDDKVGRELIAMQKAIPVAEKKRPRSPAKTLRLKSSDSLDDGRRDGYRAICFFITGRFWPKRDVYTLWGSSSTISGIFDAPDGLVDLGGRAGVTSDDLAFIAGLLTLAALPRAMHW